MSNYHDIRCSECQVSLAIDGHGVNNRPDLCFEIIRAREKIELLGDLGFGVSCLETQVFVDGYLLDARWFTAHRGHALLVVDEYGVIVRGTNGDE